MSRAGIKKVVFVNSHGGNESLMDIVGARAAGAREHAGGETGWSRFWPRDGMLTDMEKRHGIHAGDLEDLADAVFATEPADMNHAATSRCVAAKDRGRVPVPLTGSIGDACLSLDHASDPNPAGAVGNAPRLPRQSGAG